MLWLLLAVPILAVVFVFVLGMSWYIAHTTLQPPRRPSSRDPGDFGLGFEQVEIEDGGPRLRGWFVPSIREGRRPGIVLTHGWGASAEQLLPLAATLWEAGFHTVLFDVRGHGQSDPAEFVSIARYAEDIRRAFDWLAGRPEVDRDRMGLTGHSMGAAASLLAAAQDDRVKAVASSAGFADFNDLTAQLLKWRKLPRFPFRWLIHRLWMWRTGVRLLEVNPVEAIRRVHCPILLLHGDRDQVVPPDQLAKLSSARRGPLIRTRVVSGRDHHDLFADEDYGREVVRFFKETLEQRPVAVGRKDGN